MTILRLKSSNERSYFTLFGTITISDKGNDSPIIFEFLPLYFIETFKDIKTKFSFRFVSYLDIFVSQIISVFRGRLPRNEIQNVPFRCVETSVILPQVATTWTKFIWNSYEVTSPILKLSCTNLHAEVVLFYLELELFSNLCAILRVQKLRSAIIFFNSNNPLQRTYQTGELFKKYNLYRDMTDILFYYFVKISKKNPRFSNGITRVKFKDKTFRQSHTGWKFLNIALFRELLNIVRPINRNEDSHKFLKNCSQIHLGCVIESRSTRGGGYTFLSH